MSNVLKQLCVAFTVAALSGCVSQDFTDMKNEAEQVHNTITEQTYIAPTSQVTRISRPPISLKPLKSTTVNPWLNAPISIKAVGMPLSMVLTQIMDGATFEGKPPKIWFDGDVDPNKPVTLVFKSTRENVLNLLARQTKYGIETTPGKVSISHFISDLFVIDLPTGAYTGQMGTQGTSSGGNEEGQGSSQIEGQYLNTQFDRVDITTQIGNSIRALLKDDSSDDGELIGSVEVIPAMTTISVRTTPDRMAQVRTLMDNLNEQLFAQAQLDITILEFRSNLGKERGIDWNLVRDIGDGTIEFFAPGTNIVSQGLANGLAFSGTGKWDGTTALIKMLEKQGSVSTTTSTPVSILNNQPAHITQTIDTPYLSEVQSQANDNVVTSSVTRDTVKEGVDMMVSAKVSSDFVGLRISGMLSKISNDSSETVNDVSLRFLQTQNSVINFNNRLRYGQTMVIASIKQVTKTADLTKQFGIAALGGQASIENTVETLVLITPRKRYE